MSCIAFNTRNTRLMEICLYNNVYPLKTYCRISGGGGTTNGNRTNWTTIHDRKPIDFGEKRMHPVHSICVSSSLFSHSSQLPKNRVGIWKRVLVFLLYRLYASRRERGEKRLPGASFPWEGRKPLHVENTRRTNSLRECRNERIPNSTANGKLLRL